MTPQHLDWPRSHGRPGPSRRIQGLATEHMYEDIFQDLAWWRPASVISSVDLPTTGRRIGGDSIAATLPDDVTQMTEPLPSCGAHGRRRLLRCGRAKAMAMSALLALTSSVLARQSWQQAPRSSGPCPKVGRPIFRALPIVSSHWIDQATFRHADLNLSPGL
jgi:hypothetical protein